MEDALAIRKYAIVMKSGVALFVEQATAENLSRELLNATAHNFIRIKELGELINSAEIAAVYSPEKYSDYLRVKAGEHQCAYQRWHKKSQTCDCAAEIRKEHNQRMEKIRRDEEMRPPTPEQRVKIQGLIAQMRKNHPKKVQPAYRLRRTALIAYERQFGRPYVVPEGAIIIEDEEIPV